MALVHFIFFLLLIPFISSSSSSSSLFPLEARPTMSGYLPISSSSSSSSPALFFAFYEAQFPLSPLSSTPILLWLEGGPGCSSMLGNLFELGPWLLSPSDEPSLRPNPFAWNRRFGLLFVDNPLGTGFSSAADAAAIPRDQPTVAAHLWGALQGFLARNATLRARPLFLTGESYAGKYVPAAGALIEARNARAPPSRRVNLRGVAVGNGLTHPAAQVATHAASAYFSGLINERQRRFLEHLQGAAVNLTLAEKWAEASDARGKVLEWLQNATGLATLYDLTKKKPYQTAIVGDFLNRDEVKEALGVPKELTWEECSAEVAEAMHEDVMKSVKSMVEELLTKVRVLLYQGVFDLRDGVVSTEAWVREMEWGGLESFLGAERKVWEVDGELFGYMQRWGPLSHVVVSGAGHLVPADQGAAAQAMIEDWVMEKGLFSNGDTTTKKKKKKKKNNNNNKKEKDDILRGSYRPISF
ncbi:serine carboxypeptidase-like 50 [Ananas comosus]|uniref:Carboxypeptidase n=1 Tax=Ananas comosus TaxID=4615 RepID=A0A6P5GIW9_ANACO|nr:serine carboxypeptidase-like 50 [Ananas comosus]